MDVIWTADQGGVVFRRATNLQFLEINQVFAAQICLIWTALQQRRGGRDIKKISRSIL